MRISDGEIKKQKTPEKLVEIIEALNQFSSCQKTEQHCSKCSSVLNWIEGRFWLADTALEWTVPMPYCPACEPELPMAVNFPSIAA